MTPVPVEVGKNIKSVVANKEHDYSLEIKDNC
jgi:hypothetical protein